MMAQMMVVLRVLAHSNYLGCISKVRKAALRTDRWMERSKA